MMTGTRRRVRDGIVLVLIIGVIIAVVERDKSWFQTGHGHSFGTSAGKDYAVSLPSAGSNAKRAVIRSDKGGLNAASSHEDMGGCGEVCRDVDARSTMGRGLGWLQAFNLHAEIVKSQSLLAKEALVGVWQLAESLARQ